MAVQPYKIPKKSMLLQLGLGALGGYTESKGMQVKKQERLMLFKLKERELDIKEDFNIKSLEIEQQWKEDQITESQKDRALQELKLESEGYKDLYGQINKWITKKGDRKFEEKMIEKRAGIAETAAEKTYQQSLLFEKFKSGLSEVGKTLLDKLKVEEKEVDIATKKQALGFGQARETRAEKVDIRAEKAGVRAEQATKISQEKWSAEQVAAKETLKQISKEFSWDKVMDIARLNETRALKYLDIEARANHTKYAAEIQKVINRPLSGAAEAAFIMALGVQIEAMANPSKEAERIVNSANKTLEGILSLEGYDVKFPTLEYRWNPSILHPTAHTMQPSSEVNIPSRDTGEFPTLKPTTTQLPTLPGGQKEVSTADFNAVFEQLKGSTLLKGGAVEQTLLDAGWSQSKLEELRQKLGE